MIHLPFLYIRTMANRKRRHFFRALFFFLMGITIQSTLAAKGENDERVIRFRRMLENADNASSKIDALDSLVFYYYARDLSETKNYLRQMLAIATEIRDTNVEAYVYTFLGSVNRKLSEYDSAIFYYDRAIALQEQINFTAGIAGNLHNKASVYKSISRYDLAITNYLRALDYFGEQSDFTSLASLYTNLAELYFSLDNLDLSMHYWELGEAAYNKADNHLYIGNIYRGKAEIFLRKNECDRALELVKLSLESAKKNENIYRTVDSKLLLLQCYRCKEDWEDVRQIINELERDTLIGDLKLQYLTFLYYKGEYFYHVNQFSFAEKILGELNNRLHDSDLIELKYKSYRLFTRILLRENKAKEAYNSFEQWLLISDSLDATRKLKATQEIDVKYQLKERESELKNVRDSAYIQKLDLERQILANQEKETRLFYFKLITVVILLFALITVWFFIRTRIIAKRLAMSLDEKEVLFRELHHRVKNNLQIVNSILNFEMAKSGDELKEVLRQCESRIQSLSVLHEKLLESPVQDQIRMKDYFETIVMNIRHGMVKESTVSVEFSGDEISLSTHQAVLLGLILNETLTNAIKYAALPGKLSSVQVEFIRNEKGFLLTIQDNGPGLKDDFNPQRSLSTGMRLIFGLSKQLGGSPEFINSAQGLLFKLQLHE